MAAEESIDVAPEPAPPPPEAESAEKAVDTTSKVAVLGYHGFTEDPSRVRDMWIHIDKFRAQMQTLTDNKIPVISMSDLLAWRRGEKNIPPFSVVLTMDDGWDSVHSLAFPVLKEFGYPFTIYLYTDFLGGGGKSLSLEQIKELVEAGAEIGSHSMSHQDLRKKGPRSDERYEVYLKAETAGSRKILREKLGLDPVTFAYPYGTYNEAVLKAAKEAGYEAMVTVRGQKVDWETDLAELHRYIVHGDDDRPFTWAIATRAPGGLASGSNLLRQAAPQEDSKGEEPEKPLVTVRPEEGARVRDRQPLIEVDLSKLEGVDPESIDMKISGVGTVIPEFEPESGLLTYKVRQRLRLPTYWVQVTLKREAEAETDVLRWKFNIDAEANYIPEDWRPPQEREEAGSIPREAPEKPAAPETRVRS